MPLDHGYGVLRATLLTQFRDTPDDQGRWYHVNLTASADGAQFRAAVDVDSKQSAVGVQWKVVSGDTLTDALESVLTSGASVLVWGGPFTQGLEVHNVHQNQGDPPGSQWWAENGIWQDAAVAILAPSGSMKLFISKFSSQSSSTDTQGHPI